MTWAGGSVDGDDDVQDVQAAATSKLRPRAQDVRDVRRVRRVRDVREGRDVCIRIEEKLAENLARGAGRSRHFEALGLSALGLSAPARDVHDDEEQRERQRHRPRPRMTERIRER